MEDDKRIYSIHSQKGGVGKTSIAIAIAGLEKLKQKRRVLVIDCDLTGTSLNDLWRRDEKGTKKYLNHLLLSSPIDFKCSMKDIENIYVYKNKEDIEYMSSSPLLQDVSQIVPLISQEDHLHLLEHRLQEITECSFKIYDTIIFDLSPGLFGISKALIQSFAVNSWNDKIHKYKISTMAALITTSDRNDYLSLVPSFSDVISKINEKPIIISPVKLFINKAYLAKTNTGAKPRYDDAKVLQEIINDIANYTKTENSVRKFNDGRSIDEKTWNILLAGVKQSKEGAIAAEIDEDFRIDDIIPTIQHVIANSQGSQSTKMIDWINKINIFIEK